MNYSNIKATYNTKYNTTVIYIMKYITLSNLYWKCTGPDSKLQVISFKIV